jgi:hypothetical protein
MMWMFWSLYLLSFAIRPLRVVRTLAGAALTGTEHMRYAKWFVDCFYTRSCRRKLAERAAR